MGDVMNFIGETIADSSPEKVCQAAAAKNLEYVLVVGEEQSGDLYVASSSSDVAEAVWMMERVKAWFMRMYDREDA